MRFIIKSIVLFGTLSSSIVFGAALPDVGIPHTGAGDMNDYDFFCVMVAVRNRMNELKGKPSADEVAANSVWGYTKSGIFIALNSGYLCTPWGFVQLSHTQDFDIQKIQGPLNPKEFVVQEVQRIKIASDGERQNPVPDMAFGEPCYFKHNQIGGWQWPSDIYALQSFQGIKLPEAHFFSPDEYEKALQFSAAEERNSMFEKFKGDLKRRSS